MTTHGVVEITLKESRNLGLAYQEAYVALTKFLTSSLATSIGITRIAYSTGSAPQGKGGEGYWDDQFPAMPNAWSVYQWASASVPFYVLLQFAYGQPSVFGNQVPGNPGTVDGTNGNGLGIAIAMRTDGLSPWNGSSGSNGRDTKGNPVWTPGTSSLYVWPRCNTTSSIREGTMGLLLSRTTSPLGPTVNSHFSFVCDNNNIAVVTEDVADANYRCFYFGKYTVRTSVTATCPYVCLRGGTFTEDPAFKLQVYGLRAQGLQIPDGGIAHPTNPASGVLTVQTSFLNEYMAVTKQEQGGAAFRATSDEFPIHVGINDAFAAQWGYAGFIDWVRLVANAPTVGTASDQSRAIFGAAGYGTTKLSIPWTSKIAPGTGTNRSGVMF